MAKILHLIKAWLYSNFLTDNPDDFTARVVSERSFGVEQICESAVRRGGADIHAAAMQHAVEEFLKEMAYILCDGFSVNTGYFTATPLIKGSFDAPNEQFNPGKHSVLFQFNQGEKLRKDLSGIEVQILGVADSGVNIYQVIDVKTGSINDLLTPDRTLKISGHKLRITGDHPTVGVYFINEESGVRVKVEPSDMIVNNPSELIVQIPALPTVRYTLEAITQFSGAVPLKSPRTAVFSKPLTVA